MIHSALSSPSDPPSTPAAGSPTKEEDLFKQNESWMSWSKNAVWRTGSATGDAAKYLWNSTEVARNSAWSATANAASVTAEKASAAKSATAPGVQLVGDKVWSVTASAWSATAAGA